MNPLKTFNKQDSAENINETDTKLSQKENTIPPINKSDNKNTKNKSVINSNLIGQTVKNRYEIESILGHGGLCDVYLAKDKILESSGSESPYVALKSFTERVCVSARDSKNVDSRSATNTKT